MSIYLIRIFNQVSNVILRRLWLYIIASFIRIYLQVQKNNFLTTRFKNQLWQRTFKPRKQQQFCLFFFNYKNLQKKFWRKKLIMADYEDLLPKNDQGIRTHLTCELCGFEPKTKNKYRERQDHMLRNHFMDRMSEIFPTWNNFNCPSSDCVFIGKDKQSIMRHYIR